MPKHQGQTDQIKKVQLPSAIQQLLWHKSVAAAGGVAGLEVLTHFVGDGAEIEIQIEDKSGKKFDKYSDKLFGNRFWAKIPVPETARDVLYATVKLPQLGLSMKSAPLLLLPSVQITNAKWDKQEARRGDILKLTADIKGVPDGAEAQIEIWEHDAEGAHDFVTEFPVLVENGRIEAEWEFEYHEDVDDILTYEESENGYHQPEYFFRVKLADTCADSDLVKFQDWIEIELKDSSGNPLRGEKYVIHFPDGKMIDGQVDDHGYAKVMGVPPGLHKFEFPNLTQDEN